MNILREIVGGVAAPVVDFFKRRSELKAEAKRLEWEYKKAVLERKTELVREGKHADATWELESLKAHSDGWKDEAVLIVLLIPLVLVFFPTTAGAVMTGFQVLSQTPLWYRWLIVSIFFAIYGIRARRRWLSDT